MSTIYGSSSAFETARTVVVAQVTALIAAMAATTDPKITAVYAIHLGDPALVFNSVSVGLPSVEMEFPALKSSPAGPVINMMFQVELRVMIGNTNAYLDEEKVMRLCNSVVNWLETHRNMGSSFVLWQTQSVESVVRFTDTDTIGGRIRFLMRITEAFVAA